MADLAADRDLLPIGAASKRRRRIGVLVVLIVATALLAAVPAVGQQDEATQQDASQQEDAASQQSATDTDKKEGGDVSIQSTTVKASFASGTGANRLVVKVSNHGNLLDFESPATQEAVASEGYAVCSNRDPLPTVHGHDTGSVEEGFGTPTFVQPTAGAFPLTVTRNTTDGKFQLKQVWNKPDAAEKDVTVTMTLKNISSATIQDLELSRSGDIDASGTVNDRGARTFDSAWLWDDPGSDAAPHGGLKLTGLTFSQFPGETIETLASWQSSTTGTRRDCLAPTSLPTTALGGDLVMRTTYELGDFNAGQSKTVKFGYGRM